MTATGGSAVTTSDYSLSATRSYKELILLGVLLFAMAAAGLIARGQRRYTRYMKAEEAEEEAEVVIAEGATPKAQAELARAHAQWVMARAKAVLAPAKPGEALAEPPEEQTQPLRALPPDEEGDTAMVHPVHRGGTRGGTGQ
jgi:hypothetical protein